VRGSGSAPPAAFCVNSNHRNSGLEPTPSRMKRFCAPACPGIRVGVDSTYLPAKRCSSLPTPPTIAAARIAARRAGLSRWWAWALNSRETGPARSRGRCQRPGPSKAPTPPPGKFHRRLPGREEGDGRCPLRAGARQPRWSVPTVQKRLGSPAPWNSSPAACPDVPARLCPPDGLEGGDVIFDSWCIR